MQAMHQRRMQKAVILRFCRKCAHANEAVVGVHQHVLMTYRGGGGLGGGGDGGGGLGGLRCRYSSMTLSFVHNRVDTQ